MIRSVIANGSVRAALALFGCALVLDGRCLTIKEVERLVVNTPEAVAIKRRGGCPTPEYQQMGPSLALVHLRNACQRSGSGLIGNYVVDLRSGRVWSDIDQTTEVDSQRLRTLRRRLRANLHDHGDCAAP